MNKPRNYTGAIALIALFGMIVVSCSGCTTVSAELSHVSHPLRGAPFGPSYEEDTLDVANVCARRDGKRTYVEQCLGYRYVEGGFYGDDFVYTGRVGFKLWNRRN